MNQTADIIQLYPEQESPPLVCPKCGTEAACQCGVAPITKAEYALLQNREKSNRAIAAEIGVSNQTVMRARKSVAPCGATETVTGKDGKKYPAFRQRKIKIDPRRVIQTTVDILYYNTSTVFSLLPREFEIAEEDASEWVASITESMRVINKLLKRIKEAQSRRGGTEGARATR